MSNRVRSSLKLLLALGIVCPLVISDSDRGGGGARPAAAQSSPIQHVIVIMQENRSFDSYFGTFPGADGIPPSVCVPDPVSSACVAPYHDSNDVNLGGPHGESYARADIHAGNMDGFIASEQQGRKQACTEVYDPNCHIGSGMPDVMGYHDAREIPNCM